MPTPEGMTRRTADIRDEDLAAMHTAQEVDGIGDSTRIRALAQVWVEDPKVRSRVEEIAAASIAARVSARQGNAARARSARWPHNT